MLIIPFSALLILFGLFSIVFTVFFLFEFPRCDFEPCYRFIHCDNYTPGCPIIAMGSLYRDCGGQRCGLASTSYFNQPIRIWFQRLILDFLYAPRITYSSKIIRKNRIPTT